MAERIFGKLTEAEIAERSRRLAQQVGALSSLKEQKKEYNAEIGKEIKELEKEIQQLATAIRSGQEERDAQMELSGVRKIKADIA
jgi:peptidoglycan hydrolase CwlO-like protein